MILFALVFEILCGKTDKQTDRHMNAAENSTNATTISVSNESVPLIVLHSL